MKRQGRVRRYLLLLVDAVIGDKRRPSRQCEGPKKGDWTIEEVWWHGGPECRLDEVVEAGTMAGLWRSQHLRPRSFLLWPPAHVRRTVEYSG